jgi:K+-transporting ATPase ATPase A chain
VIVGALTFFPVLSLAPIVEHFLMNQGRLFSLVVMQLTRVTEIPWLS